MNMDLSDMLNNWEYNPDENIRIIKGSDGNRKLQIRIPLGIEQYELSGRPDGKKPHDFNSYLDYIKNRISSENNTRISDNDFAELQEEGLMIYNRYISLFQIGEFELTERDTSHNLELCDIVEKYGSDMESRDLLLQYRPYILHINALSKYMTALSQEDLVDAERILDEAISSIENMKPVDTPIYKLEVRRSLMNLRKAKEKLGSEDTSDLPMFGAMRPLPSEGGDRAFAIHRSRDGSLHDCRVAAAQRSGFYRLPRR